MKYGAHCYIFTNRWGDDQLHVMDTLSELGGEVLEIGVGDDVSFDPKLTGKHAASLGLELVVSPGSQWPMHCDLSADEEAHREAGLAWHKQQVDLAVAVGAKMYTGCLYGHTGVVKRRIPPGDEYLRIADGLNALAAYGAKSGVKIALEAMSHFRTHVANRPEQIMRLINLADHDNLYTIMDTYHMITEIRDFAKAVRTYGERLVSVHCCENDRGVPGGGVVPWSTLFPALQDIGFDGYLTLEAYNSADVHFAHERAMFHDVCSDASVFVRRGFEFLRKWEEKTSSE